MDTMGPGELSCIKSVLISGAKFQLRKHLWDIVKFLLVNAVHCGGGAVVT